VARRAQKWQGGFRAGKRIDIKKRMQEKALGISPVESKAWQKRELPQEKDYAITLLVDLSGSMRGQKIQETFKAAIVLAEVLNRLSINTEILGFNDQLYEYQGFNQNMGKEVREHMGGMLQEVSAPAAEWNDDGWAVQQASERLARQKTAEKFLFVLSTITI
jgi:nitric oxide reductase activation protein